MKSNRLLVAEILCAVLLTSFGCADDAANGSSVENACKQEGATICDANGGLMVCRGGVYKPDSCPTNETCVSGACRETCKAASFEARCNGEDARWVCDGGFVASVACKSGEQCDKGTCAPKIVEETCDSDYFDIVCASDHSRKICDGGKVAEVACDSGESCEGGICQTFNEACSAGEAKCTSAVSAKKCIDGRFHEYYCKLDSELCSKGQCVPESSVQRCLLDDAPVCRDDKLVKCEYGVQVARDCTDGQICLGDKCVQCNPETFVQTCTDNKETRCDSDGNIVTTDCLSGYVCNGTTDSCTKSCETSPCDEHYKCDEDSKLCVFEPQCDEKNYKTSCADDNHVRTCVSPGLYQDMECPDDTLCSGGECQCSVENYTGGCMDNAPTYCDNGVIRKASVCTGAKPVCYNGECVACTSETARHDCKDNDIYTALTCIENVYYWKNCENNEICKSGLGCVSKCGDTFKSSCDASGKLISCDESGNVVVKSCDADQECKEGECVSIIGNPCNYYEFQSQCIVKNEQYVYVLYCDKGEEGIQEKACSYVNSTNAFCGKIQGAVDCYTPCEEVDNYTCLTFSESNKNHALIGTCKAGADYLGNPRNGFVRESGICAGDNLSVSCHLNNSGHATYDYLYCDMIGGGTCDGTKKTCASLPSCTVKGGSCSGSTAINCIFDSAQNGGEGALVQTTQTCGENVPCVQYSDDGTTYAVCKETITFKFTVNGVETPYDISTLGTCLEMGGQKVLGRAYKTADHKYSARTITCHNDCVTNPDGFSYCK